MTTPIDPMTEAGRILLHEHSSGTPHMARHILAIEAEAASQPEPAVTEALRAADRLANTAEMMLHWTSADDEAHRSWLPPARADMKRELEAYRALAAVPAPSPAPAAERSEPDAYYRGYKHGVESGILIGRRSSRESVGPAALAAEPQEGEPTTKAGRSTLRDFGEYVRAVPTNGDFAIGGLLDTLRRDRQSSLDQICGAILAIEAEARAASASVLPLDVERLAVAINDAGVEPDELRLGRDLSVPAKRIAAAYAAETPEQDR